VHYMGFGWHKERVRDQLEMLKQFATNQLFAFLLLHLLLFLSQSKLTSNSDAGLLSMARHECCSDAVHFSSNHSE